MANAWAGWFDVSFRGDSAEGVPHPVTLSTHPSAGFTHWGQQVFIMPQASYRVVPGSELHGTVEVRP